MNLITLGIGPGSAVKYLLTGGLDIGEAAPVEETTGGGPGFNIAFGRKAQQGIDRRIRAKREEREALRRELDALANPRSEDAPEPERAAERAANATAAAPDTRLAEIRSLIGSLNREIARLEAERRLYGEEEEAAMLLLMA